MSKPTSLIGKGLLYVVLVFLTCVFVGPILFILMNSFKTKFSIAAQPFALPLADMWAGIENYVTGLALSGFFMAIVWSFTITILSVLAIVFFCAMTAYYITRIKTWWTSALYYLFVFFDGDSFPDGDVSYRKNLRCVAPE